MKQNEINMERFKKTMDLLLSFCNWKLVALFLSLSFLYYVTSDLNMLETYKFVSLIAGFFALLFFSGVIVYIVCLIGYLLCKHENKKSNIEKLIDEESKKGD